MIFWLYIFVLLPFSIGLLLFAPRSYGILREQQDLPGVHSAKVCSFFPLWVPVEGLVAADPLSRLKFEVVPILRSVYAL